MNETHKIQIIPIQRQIQYGDICQSIRYKDKYQIFGAFENSYQDECKPFQLLLLSNEEIKDGDWYLESCLVQSISQYKEENYINRNLYYKIIASYPKLDKLPIFSKEFIEEWCSNPKDEVLVEYDKEYVDTDCNDIDLFEYMLLVSKGEIICSFPKTQLVESPGDFSGYPAILEEKVKEVTYTESEVLDIIDDLFHCFASSHRHEAKEYFLESYKKK